MPKYKWDNVVCLPEFLEDWALNCGIPQKQMKGIYEGLVATFKDYIDADRPICLARFVQIVPKELSKIVTFHDFRSNKMVTMERLSCKQYICKLSDYLKFPYVEDK